MALCRAGCGKPTWNRQPGEYCSRTCRDGLKSGGAPVATFSRPGSRGASGPLCCRPGCMEPTYNSRPGNYCGRGCRAGFGKCLNSFCEWKVDGKEGEYCSRACRCIGTGEWQPRSEGFCMPAAPNDPDVSDVVRQFQTKWRSSSTPTCPAITAVFKIVPSMTLFDAFRKASEDIGNVPLFHYGKSPGNRQRRFHGTTMTCARSFRGSLCSDPGCSACQIIRGGFKLACLGKGTGNKGHYGPGLYSTSMSATAKGYGNVVLVTTVAVGKPELTSDRTTSGLASGFHSRVASKTSGVDEIVVFSDEQMMPQFLLLF